MTGISPDEKRYLLRFLAAGGLSVATDLGVFLLLNKHLGWAYPLAKGLSYAAGMVLGFGLNKWWTFGSHRRSAAEPLTYAVLYGLTLGVNVLVYGWTLKLFLGLGQVELSGAAAFLAATGLTTVLNYLGLRLVTFRRGIAEAHAAPPQGEP